MKYMQRDSNDTNNGEEFFFDTCVLVHAYDANETEKRASAKELVEKVFRGKLKGAVSNQILGELFFVLTTRKNVTKTDAENIFLGILESENWSKINYNTNTVKSAINTSKNIGVKLWDVVIAETAKENGITKIITENEKDFSKIPGIKVVNPFRK